MEEEERAVVDAWQAGAEAPVESLLVVLLLDERLPAASTPRRRAGWRACSRTSGSGRPSLVKLSPNMMFSGPVP